MSKIFALVDCNNFFVSCERVFRPDLWDKPVAVLSNNDGCVVARSNEVKALGVPMGAPFFKVRELMARSQATLFSGNPALYGDISQRIVTVLQSMCPDIEVYSVDESFLEISTLGITDYEQWGREVRALILQWIGVPVSIGIASTKTLAKAAADYVKKHDELQGAIYITDQNHELLLRWLPLGDVWGVGRRSAPKLQAMGLSSAWDFSRLTDDWLHANMNTLAVKTAHELRGESCVELHSQTEPQQSILRSRSFGHNVTTYYELESAVATFAAQAAAKLRQQDEIATQVTTFIRNSSGARVRYSMSHSRQVTPATSDTGAIIAAAVANLKQIYDEDFTYKKAGVLLTGLVSSDARQLTFSDNPQQIDKKTKLMFTVDEINARFGKGQICHATERPLDKSWASKSNLRSPSYTTDWNQLSKVSAH